MTSWNKDKAEDLLDWTTNREPEPKMSFSRPLAVTQHDSTEQKHWRTRLH